MKTTTNILLLTLLLAFVHNSTATYLTDQKKNCSSPSVNQSYCYTIGKLDPNGQLMSCRVPGTFALTFDDGPANYTSMVLDTLKKYNMKATFFLIGKKLIGNKAIVQRMINEGHQIGSHTYSHPYLTDLTADMVSYEITKWESILVSQGFSGALGGSQIPNYMRAPHGAINPTVYSVAHDTLGYSIINWGVLTSDTSITPVTTTSDIVNYYLDWFGGPTSYGVLPNKLVIISQQHDTMAATANSLDSVLSYLSNNLVSKGTRFVTIAECMGNSPPAYRPNPRFANDPTCSHGIKDTKSNACCSLECGTCGGNGCGTRVPYDSSNKCCTTNILSNNIPCTLSIAPCVVV